jgi:hypothetical protein
MSDPGNRNHHITGGGKVQSIAGYRAQQIAMGKDIDLIVAQILRALGLVSESLRNAGYLKGVNENNRLKFTGLRSVRNFFEQVLKEADLDGFCLSLIVLLNQGNALQNTQFNKPSLEELGDEDSLEDLIIDQEDADPFGAIMKPFRIETATGRDLKWTAIQTLVTNTQGGYQPKKVVPPVVVASAGTTSSFTSSSNKDDLDLNPQHSDGTSAKSFPASARTVISPNSAVTNHDTTGG